MTTATRKSTSPNKAKPAETETATAFNGADLNVMHNGKHLMQNWVASGQEIARFYSKRLKTDVTFANALASCKTPQEFLDVWSTAASTMVHDYADEFDRMITLSKNSAKSDQAAAIADPESFNHRFQSVADLTCQIQCSRAGASKPSRPIR